MSIAILCPSRARPEQFKRMWKSANATSIKGNVALYAAWDSSEEGYTHDDSIAFSECLPDGMPTAFKWNLLAEYAFKNPNIKLFMLAADDMVFTTPCWDKALMDHYTALENKIHVYAFQDSRDENGTPHPIVTREWIEAMGYFVPPIFLHWFVDSWTVEIARANNCFTHMKDYLLVHDKPSDKGEGDETHNRIRQMGWRERDGWVNEKCLSWKELQVQRLKYIMRGELASLAIHDELLPAMEGRN